MTTDYSEFGWSDAQPAFYHELLCKYIERLLPADGTPILDIKPYIPYADCQKDATGGFTDTAGDFLLKVEFPPELLEMVPEDRRAALIGVLSHDPRPSYQRNPERVYGMEFAGVNVRFRVAEETLLVVDCEKV